MKFEQQMIKDIKKKYGDNLTIFIGDWNYSGASKGNAPVKGKFYRKLLDNNFKCYILDEYRTSMLHHQTEMPCGTCKLKFNNKKNYCIKLNLIR